MSQKHYDYLVFIGRFQPIHKGHLKVMKKALELSEKLIVVLGSHNQPRTMRNPWTSMERKAMILEALGEKHVPWVEFVHQEDYTYNMDKWVASIQGAVNTIIHRTWTADPIEIGIIGHDKDHSSYYLNFFPQWDHVYVSMQVAIDATQVRSEVFNPYHSFSLGTEHIVPETFEYISRWVEDNESDYDFIKDENAHIIEYKKQWAHSPFPPTFNTVDAIVVQSGHILLVRRGTMPGKGQWAMPGGFVNSYEKLKDACIRELREETKLKVPEPVLRGSIKNEKIYDDPYRSQRGRTITKAYFFHLRDEESLPKVKGADDADKAKWIPLGSLDRSKMFEDHFDIIDDMVKL